MGNKDRKQLLEALAQFVAVNSETALDCFLTGYAGEEWAKAKDRGRPATQKGVITGK